MPTATLPTSYKPAPTGKFGLLPNKDGTYDTTVVSPGGSSMFGLAIAGVHVICWIVAIVLSFVSWTTRDGKLQVSDQAKGMAMFQAIMAIVSFAGAALHAAFARMPAPVSSAFLLVVVIFTTMLSGANMAGGAVSADSDVYNMSTFAAIFVSLSSAMVIAFYVEMAVRGKVTD